MLFNIATRLRAASNSIMRSSRLTVNGVSLESNPPCAFEFAFPRSLRLSLQLWNLNDLREDFRY